MVVATGALLMAGPGAALAHECFVANRVFDGAARVFEGGARV